MATFFQIFCQVVFLINNSLKDDKKNFLKEQKASCVLMAIWANLQGNSSNLLIFVLATLMKGTLTQIFSTPCLIYQFTNFLFQFRGGLRAAQMSASDFQGHLMQFCVVKLNQLGMCLMKLEDLSAVFRDMDALWIEEKRVF